jgi:hypothetical protein
VRQREALSGVAEALMEKLHYLREQDVKWADGARLAELGTKDHERVLLAWDELEYRLQKIITPSTRRKQQVTPPDPNQVALFE